MNKIFRFDVKHVVDKKHIAADEMFPKSHTDEKILTENKKKTLMILSTHNLTVSGFEFFRFLLRQKKITLTFPMTFKMKNSEK